MSKVDGNVQDISVHDKDVAALAATEEAQDMSTLNRVVVPVGAFTDPNNPGGASASVNMSLDESPFEHSKDYGDGIRSQKVTGTEDVHAKGAADDAGHPGDRERRAAVPTVEFPEDRKDWAKKHWQAKARDLGLATSGNTDAVKGRVEEQERVDEEYKNYNATDWKEDIEDVETLDDLAELRAAYDRSGADFSTVVEAFTERETALNNES